MFEHQSNQVGDWIPSSNEPKLFFTDGDVEKVRTKALYFIRNTGPDDKPVNPNETCDSTLICGQFSANPLRDLEAALSVVYEPNFTTRENWGKAEKNHLKDFMAGLNKFVSDMQENLKSLVGGLQLKKPDVKLDALDPRNGKSGNKVDAAIIDQFEDLLEEWCDQIEDYLQDKSQEDFEEEEAGPMTELEWWRRRMQRLTSITEQLKTKECKTVLSVLQSWTKSQQDTSKQKLFLLLRRWKLIDIKITEAANEAKDNVKYLFTLEKFLEPLYTGDPTTIVDTLPALMNSIKMIHTIARYYNTTTCMTNLFVKITNQMIKNCGKHICNTRDSLWQMEPDSLVLRLESCLKLNEAYQEHYRLTKDKLLTMPKGKQFDFNEQHIFGRFDLFCRRLTKLIDMFSTIQQFRSLAQHKMEGMEKLLDVFFKITAEFKAKGHDLLDYHNNTFDRDFVEFNVHISELESSLQHFINESFESITSITHSLNLLKKFQLILHRESLKSDLDNKFTIIFQTYGMELQQVQSLYEKHKHNPPIPRNLPPVAGNITWSRHLLKRIEEPMKKFESNQNVLNSKEAKRIIKTYNKVARTLVAFEYLWYQAWVQSIETAKAGLQATLIIRHPEDKKLYVNFDQEILQLIREAKCLDRMGIDIPESAKIVLLQEDKFKTYYDDLLFALNEYQRIREAVSPQTEVLLIPHFNDMDYKLRPGMITLTWTSMNIDAYKHHIHSGLQRLEELVTNINDIIENRIKKNLSLVSRCMLMDLSMSIVSLDSFVQCQEKHIVAQSALLQGKNVEIENAVGDLIKVINAYPLDDHVRAITNETEVEKLKEYWNNLLYQALLKATKQSLNTLKKRVGSRGSTGFLFVEKPFFEVDVGVSTPSVVLEPSLDDIQRAINKAAQAVLSCSKWLYDWDQSDLPVENRRTFFSRITRDIEIVRVVLLLTGSVGTTKLQVQSFLSGFGLYDWLWKDDMSSSYNKFISKSPTLEDYAAKLGEFESVAAEIEYIPPVHNIGALQLRTSNLKTGLIHQATDWTVLYSSKLHSQAKKQMDELLEYMNNAERRLQREVNDLNDLRSVMDHLKEIRDKESGIQMEISPVMDMYRLLELYLPSNIIQKEEMDSRSMLRPRWRALVDKAETVTDTLNTLQLKFKRKLLKDVRVFQNDVTTFRADYIANGPMVPNIEPMEAVERLKRFKEEFVIRKRKFDLYRGGEILFALPQTNYPELDETNAELRLLDKLYDLYVDVIETRNQWREIRWADFAQQVDHVSEKVDKFAMRCRKMPSKLRDWAAYNDLQEEIKGFQVVLPLLTELTKDSVRVRHWKQVMEVTGATFSIAGSDMKLSELLDANLENYKEHIEEITDSAEKQQAIEHKLAEIKEQWDLETFEFKYWKEREVPIVSGVVPVMEELEEAQMNLQAMLTMRHVAPFKVEATELLKLLSETADTLERWVKVQMLWCSLESVFTSGDIAKQLPLESKKFSKVDKDWTKVMAKAHDTRLVVGCCGNELLQNNLPIMYSELEKCQKSLESYLEQKRGLFPRFYFVSNLNLLQILSQGSNPIAIQPYYEKIFDAIAYVKHEDADHGKLDITHIVSRIRQDQEVIRLRERVSPTGNIEKWLNDLLTEQKFTMKGLAHKTALQAQTTEISSLEKFVDGLPAQFALLGIQLIWTTDLSNALDECRTNKKVMKEVKDKCSKIVDTLSSWCLHKKMKDKMERKKIETLVTIQVHQRDVCDQLVALYKQKKLTDGQDFEWLKQARFCWRPDEPDHMGTHGTCLISVTDVDFPYQHEYLGCKERLVITPLTDRCYITLAQAMGMFFGGAPAGPAGTGKTETVKDFGRTLGLYVVVTNCTDQMRYHHCAKIFKGLCAGGLWGCFDEFNRITLPVLSVVAQQVLSVLNAKKAYPKNKTFTFPGSTQEIYIHWICGFFITMNPGYAGRQELPENLKALFRSVAMMVPDREIIMKVKLCSVGYTSFTLLARKFQTLYSLCEEQLSNQKHYDFGLRNVLSVLRTAGQTLRDSGGAEKEAVLVYRTLRDMNLSKLVAQDVPLFLSLLKDLFPDIPTPEKAEYPKVEKAVLKLVEERGLIAHPSWLLKVTQLYETIRVRHGIMLSGPAGGGKSTIQDILKTALSRVNNCNYKIARLNPKSILASQMYGQVDKMSGEWTTGVFAAMWAKSNNRQNKFNTWLTADGPVDTIWIEDLNTVLDDNRILTLANGDRIPMTSNCLIMFENENLRNASPATVSRVGIIYVSSVDLGWWPVAQSWIKRRQDPEMEEVLTRLFIQYIGENTADEPGHLFDWLARNTKPVMTSTRLGAVTGCFRLLESLISEVIEDGSDLDAAECERLFLYSLAWSLGGLLTAEDRIKFDDYLRTLATEEGAMPLKQLETDTIFEYYVDLEEELMWEKWLPAVWDYPAGDTLDFSNLLVPTMDSIRSMELLDHMHKNNHPVLMVGAVGTAKTSTALMFFGELDVDVHLVKQINFSFATTGGLVQTMVSAEVEKRGGKNFGPPPGKKLVLFFDDMSMPEINVWGDQPTIEFVRQLVEEGGFCFLEKDKRGDFCVLEDLSFVSCMQTPQGGRNDIPARMKRQFFCFNIILPSVQSINDIFGQMLDGRFPDGEVSKAGMAVVNKLTAATIDLWTQMRTRMLPTPSKFHYIFNLRDLSRVFQGILLTPKEVINTGGEQVPASPEYTILRLWAHECERVFSDKLTVNEDKAKYHQFAMKATTNTFGEKLAADLEEENYFANFWRDAPDGEDVIDDDEEEDLGRPMVYEPAGTLEQLRERVQFFLADVDMGYNTRYPADRMDLILFDDALKHLLRISRIIGMDRGSALLVGVGGSGKQSLTRLAAFISQQNTFQITLTKTYGVNAFKDDLRTLFSTAGVQRKHVTFLFTDAEVKDETFLEFINSILLTGDVAGLFTKEEYLAMCAEIQPFFCIARPEQTESPANLKKYFTDCVRDNLHIVLAMSPMNPLFAVRARKFPGLISCCTIDWFLPWPKEALIAVSAGMIDVEDFEMQATKMVKEQVINHMGYVHQRAQDVCDEYFSLTKRNVCQTPKSYLSFLKNYKASYTKKLNEVALKEKRTLLGLEKLIKGSDDVAAMKIVLKEEEAKLEKATRDTNAMLADLRENAMLAQNEGDKVAKIKSKCEADATRIASEKAACEADLAKAQPFVDKAIKAINSIKPKHIAEIKRLAQPASIIKLVFDGCLLLFKKPMSPVHESTMRVAKQDIIFIDPSWKEAQVLMSDARFLQSLFDFGNNQKDYINEETIELLEPYIELQTPDGNDAMSPAIAKKASVAAEGLCTWVIAMTQYHHAAKIIKPKMEALALAQANLALANAKLDEATKRFEICAAKLKKLQDQFEAQMAQKLAIEEGLNTTKAKMSKAENLITGLSGERTRWEEDKERFADIKQKLVGDCALACAFISYCGPFNQQYRNKIVTDYFTKDLLDRNVPVSTDMDVVSFLVDQGTIGDWHLQGLPSDPLSSQNGILVTTSSRFPLMVDPQKQGLSWILRRERMNDKLPPGDNDMIDMNDKKLKDKLEYCMSEGKSLIIAVEEEVDPMLDPVLEKRIQVRGKTKYISVADKKMDYSDDFQLYLVTRLPNPHFSPELQAKTTLIDFTVTQKGLEEQLLGKVIQREQKALEEQLNIVVEQVTENTKALLKLDADLLERLTSGTGNLLDDDELVGVLKNVKDTALDVKKKLVVATDTRKAIETKREQYRPVAERGAVLYFSVVDMSHVNVMYQVSLKQFLQLFVQSMDDADTSKLLTKRVENIIETMTYIVYRYINRGLYEKDRLIFVFIVTMKILITSDLIQQSEMDIFLRGGAALDINSVQAKPFSWMSDSAWLNIVVLTQRIPFFKTLTNDIRAADVVWKKWYEDNTPEALPLPSYEQQISDNKEIGPFLRLLLVRALRMDRTMLCISDFISNTPQMGRRYTEPVTDTVESVHETMDNMTPVIFLLSVGADPTDAIENLAKKRKQSVESISMGEGQSVPAIAAIKNAWSAGTWVLLQNCELGLDLMVDMEQMILKSTPNENFRLMFTANPHPQFPLGLLQLCTKITNEPPQGLRAGLLRSFNTMVDQDRIERIESSHWRRLVHTLCFMHSIVHERKKFGPLGWNIPYEFNTGDLAACLTFLEKHLFDHEISWPTVQYMVSSVQYGGKVTDDKDRLLLKCYATRWLSTDVMNKDFTFNPNHPIQPIPNNFVYKILDQPDVQEYRNYSGSFPNIDSPEVIGLHPNADLTFRLKEVKEMLDTLMSTKPKGGAGSSAGARDKLVSDKAGELLEKLPPNFVEEKYLQRIKAMGGIDIPLNIFLYQEIQRIQAVIFTVRTTLVDLRLAINGEVVMTTELVNAIQYIFDARVPVNWVQTVGGDEFSWYLPTLGLWYNSLGERTAQYRKWLDKGRPNSFWMTGFFNPQGFLTGMKQELTRLHRSDKWALDDVLYHTEVTSYESPERAGQQTKGVFVHGLFMEGAQWDEESKSISESLPKILFDNLPVILVSVVDAKRKPKASNHYLCPVYKYPARTDRYLIFEIPLPSGSRPSWHWVFRGVAILCSIE